MLHLGWYMLKIIPSSYNEFLHIQLTIHRCKLKISYFIILTLTLALSSLPWLSLSSLTSLVLCLSPLLFDSPSSLYIRFFSLFFVSFLAIFGWVESLVARFKWWVFLVVVGMGLVVGFNRGRLGGGWVSVPVLKLNWLLDFRGGSF